MKANFDRYGRDIIPKKGLRTQKDNLSELRQLRPVFDSAPIDALTPSEIKDIEDASLLLRHTKGDITERVYRRVGAIAKPSK